MSKTTLKTKLSRRQYFFIIVQTEIGVGILSLPYDLHSKAKQDGWISLLIGGGAAANRAVGYLADCQAVPG